MAAGVWTIREIRRFGDATSATSTGGDGEVFIWTSDAAALVDADGGARAAPRSKPWTIGGRQTVIRTKYPGALVPSFQVLGPEQKDQLYQGLWQDKYNFRGYAVAEMRRFEAMCRRGNLIQISFQQQAFEGLITEWDFPYSGDYEVGYKFTYSVSCRLDQNDEGASIGLGAAVGTVSGSGRTRSPATAISPDQALVRADLSVGGLIDTHALLPRHTIAGDLGHVAADSLGAIAQARDQLSATIDRSKLGSVGSVDQWRRLGSQFRAVKSEATNLLGDLASVRTDTTLTVQTMKGFLDLEDWNRSTAYFARSLMGESASAARDMEARATPQALRFYRPQAGESLMAIARRYYGTPSAWGLIADRNHLTAVTLTGDEVLVIPERSGA